MDTFKIISGMAFIREKRDTAFTFTIVLVFNDKFCTYGGTLKIVRLKD